MLTAVSPVASLAPVSNEGSPFRRAVRLLAVVILGPNYGLNVAGCERLHIEESLGSSERTRLPSDRQIEHHIVMRYKWHFVFVVVVEDVVVLMLR